MLCRRPYRLGNDEYGCGQCMPCRVNRRRVWTARLMLEASEHKENCFITLTYSDECLPKDRSLKPEEVKLWLKRVRARLAPLKVRYYLVGEYGTEKGRPHYHVALFGFRPADHIHPRVQKALKRVCVCVICSAWRRGGVDVADLTSASAGYIISYVLKGMTRPLSCGEERHPEFARMSKKPGLGAAAIDSFGEEFTSEEGSKWFAKSSGDVPLSAKNLGRTWPLGRYLRNRLVAASGVSKEHVEELSNVRRKAVALEPLESRERRERSRVQHYHNAVARAKIAMSKGGKSDETR